MANILGSVLQFLTNKVRQARGYVFGIGGNMQTSPDINATEAITRGYEGNGTVYSIVNKDANKFASIPQYVYIKSGTEREEVENELSKLLNRPNEYQGQDAFKAAVRGFYKICGEAFIWLNRGDITERFDNITNQFIQRTDAELDAMPVLEMYVVPSNKVYLVPDPGNVFGILGYVIEISGKRLFIRKNDMIHWRTLNMCFDEYDRQHLRGMSPLKPGKRLLQQNNDATDSAVRMHQNDGARGIAFNETYNDLDPKQESSIREVVDKKINNNDIKGAIATVQGKWDYINFGGTAVDMELLSSINLSDRKLCMLFDVPFEFYQDTTYENKEKAMKGWLYNSIIPASKQYDDELNRILLKSFGLEGGNYIIACDYSELPELQTEMAQLVTQLNMAWWVTPNEKRKAMKYEANPDPLMDEVWVPTGMTPISQLNGDGFDQMVNDLSQQGITN